MTFAYGGWSDAIHYGAMEPSLTVRPLGDIHANLDFLHQVAEPFGHTSGASIVDGSIANYASNYQEPDVTGKTVLDPRFLEAFRAETGLAVDDFRRAADLIEDEGIRREEAVFVLRLSELEKLLVHENKDCRILIDYFSLSPRKSWRTIPDAVAAKDFWPWRFRRRMSLIRRPLVQMTEEADPEFLVTPGLFRDAVAHTTVGLIEGSFSHEQLRSSEMTSWAGKVATERGAEFTREVADALQKNGWEVKTEVLVRTILSRRDAERYGDIDVLAVSQDRSRVLLLECKHLHFHKTVGEIAEQVKSYRGKRDGKKRDDMLKHIERTKVLRDRVGDLTSFLGLEAAPFIEAWVVFRHPVPMLHSWDPGDSGVRVCTYDSLMPSIRGEADR